MSSRQLKIHERTSWQTPRYEPTTFWVSLQTFFGLPKEPLASMFPLLIPKLVATPLAELNSSRRAVGDEPNPPWTCTFSWVASQAAWVTNARNHAQPSCALCICLEKLEVATKGIFFTQDNYSHFTVCSQNIRIRLFKAQPGCLFNEELLLYKSPFSAQTIFKLRRIKTLWVRVGKAPYWTIFWLRV